eukprot:4258600-Prymnesium_polylepis.1
MGHKPRASRDHGPRVGGPRALPDRHAAGMGPPPLPRAEDAASSPRQPAQPRPRLPARRLQAGILVRTPRPPPCACARARTTLSAARTVP